MKKKKKKTIIIHFVTAVIIILLVVLLFTYKNMYEKAPTEAWLLNGSSETMYVKNMLLAISTDYKKQFITGGSIYFNDQTIIDKAKKIEVYICYDSDNVCVFSNALESSSAGVLKGNNPMTVGSRDSDAFADGFVKDINNIIFKNRLDFDKKLESMYLKVIVYYENGNEELKLYLTPINKIYKRVPFYEIPMPTE